MGEDRTEIGPVNSSLPGDRKGDVNDSGDHAGADDGSIRSNRFTVRGMLIAIAILALLFSIEPLQIGLIVSGVFLVVLMLVQLPLYFLLGAFRLKRSVQADENDS
jgi:hypothetical protein